MSFEVESGGELLGPNGQPLGIMNTVSVSTGTIARDPQVRQLAQQLSSWVETARSYGSGQASMFDRTLYTPPDSPYERMRVAQHAVANDDVISGIADATEALAFHGGLKWESSDPNEADLMNQLSADLNLDDVIRSMWRELFAVDQCVVAKLWDSKTYTARGETENGNKKKKRYDVFVPTRLTVLDSARCVPIGNGPLREDRMAWQATAHEVDDWNSNYTATEPLDPLMTAFFTGPYTPGQDETAELTAWRVQTDSLLAMNPDWVFRHTATRPDYKKFPDIRMRSVFPLLDLKRHLIASDRASLVGAANYILLIRKGSDEQPATQAEIANLRAGYNFLAKLPVIISDHRLEIDVIAPKLDFILRKESYETLDNRILTRTLATFAQPGVTGTAGAATFSDVLAASIQSRRHMIKRTLEKEIARAIVEHPRNEGKFKTKPSLVFTPRTVAIGTDQAVLSALLALRTQREMSRDTILEYLGLDEATEAQRLELEEQIYDDIFKTAVPYSSPETQPNTGVGGAPKAAPEEEEPPAAPARRTPNGTAESPSVSGRRGGRPAGGGNSSRSPASTAAPKTRNGNKSTS
jgi:hypothetical protein